MGAPAIEPADRDQRSPSPSQPMPAQQGPGAGDQQDTRPIPRHEEQRIVLRAMERVDRRRRGPPRPRRGPATGSPPAAARSAARASAAPPAWGSRRHEGAAAGDAPAPGCGAGAGWRAGPPARCPPGSVLPALGRDPAAPRPDDAPQDRRDLSREAPAGRAVPGVRRPEERGPSGLLVPHPHALRGPRPDRYRSRAEAARRSDRPRRPVIASDPPSPDLCRPRLRAMRRAVPGPRGRRRRTLPHPLSRQRASTGAAAWPGSEAVPHPARVLRSATAWAPAPRPPARASSSAWARDRRRGPAAGDRRCPRSGPAPPRPPMRRNPAPCARTSPRLL